MGADRFNIILTDADGTITVYNFALKDFLIRKLVKF